MMKLLMVLIFISRQVFYFEGRTFPVTFIIKPVFTSAKSRFLPLRAFSGRDIQLLVSAHVPSVGSCAT